jgi:hypothetical protein
MGVSWTDPIGVTPQSLGAPELTAGVSVLCPGHEEGPDTVVRPGAFRSEADGPYDPLPVRRYGGLGFPRARSRTVAPVNTNDGHRRGVRDQLTRLLRRRIRATAPGPVNRVETSTHHPEPSRSNTDGNPQLVKSEKAAC